jgi:hypothetical protein
MFLLYTSKIIVWDVKKVLPWKKSTDELLLLVLLFFDPSQ